MYASDPRNDINGKRMWPGDTCVMARPAGYKSNSAMLEMVQIVRFTDKGVTVWPKGGSQAFNTPYRQDKFMIVSRGPIKVSDVGKSP